MGFYQDQIVPLLINARCGREILPPIAAVSSPPEGRVLEIGIVK
jgi:hypothetical protein